MNKKLLFLSLGLGLFFTSCQTDSVSEDLQTDTAASIEGVKKGSTNKIHEPVFFTAIHEPVFLTQGFEDCFEFPAYTGSADLNVMKGETLNFGRGVQVENLRVGGDLNICGDLEVSKNTVIRRNGELTTVGIMMVGTEGEPKDVVINYGGHLNIKGALVVTGDLILNTGATLEFLSDDAENNWLWVMGEVRTAEYSFLRGAYNVYDGDDHDHEEHEH